SCTLNARGRRADPYTICVGCNGPMSSQHSTLPASTNWHLKCYEASQSTSDGPTESDVQMRKSQIAG
ncbi:hypothetical protein BDQ17DRAFT_1346507, partial [Cyathus striatus]